MSQKIYTAYAAAVLAFFTVANHQGFVLKNFFVPSHHHKAGQNHYHK